MKNFKLSTVSPIQFNPVDLDPLDHMLGKWKGTGFNQIWRPANRQTIQPVNPNPGNDFFLQFNQTTEELTFNEISKEIPNRGLFDQLDINLHGIDYLQKIQDAVVKDAKGNPVGIHLEPGLWLVIPKTDNNPINPATIARLANIPHGTSFVSQGNFNFINGAPVIDPIDITPFQIGNPAGKINFPDVILANPSDFRTKAADIPAVTQQMVDDPNSVLRAANVGLNFVETLVINISTQILNPPVSGGGLSNISFLEGVGGNANAQSAQVDAIFWISKIKTKTGRIVQQLQYTQRVLLNFNGLSWPHISVATLRKK